MAKSLSSLGLVEASGARVVVADVVRDRGEETVNLIKDAGGEAICVAADISQSSDVQTMVRLIKQAGGEAIFVQTDVSKSADVQNMVRAAVETFGRLDCAINSAAHGIGLCPLADISEDDWERAQGIPGALLRTNSAVEHRRLRRDIVIGIVDVQVEGAAGVIGARGMKPMPPRSSLSQVQKRR